MAHATNDDIFAAIELLTPADKIQIWQSASRFLGGTRFSEPADLFHETLDLLLCGSRHWPTNVPFLVYLRKAMMSVAATDRERHETVRTRGASVEDLSDYSQHASLRTASVIDWLLDQERVAEAVQALHLARAALARDRGAQRVIDGWLDAMDRDEICAGPAMSLAAYDSARKRALRETRKHVPSAFAQGHAA
jgi:hypothetical protein